MDGRRPIAKDFAVRTATRTPAVLTAAVGGEAEGVLNSALRRANGAQKFFGEGSCFFRRE